MAGSLRRRAGSPAPAGAGRRRSGPAVPGGLSPDPARDPFRGPVRLLHRSRDVGRGVGRRRGLASSRRSGCATSGSRGSRTARSVAGLVALWREAAPRPRLIPELERVLRRRLAQADGLHRPSARPGAAHRAPAPTTRPRCSGGSRPRAREIDRAAAIARGPGRPRARTSSPVRRWLSAVGRPADDLLALWAMRHGAQPPWAGAVRADPRPRRPARPGRPGRQAAAISRRSAQRGRRIGEILAGLLDRVLDDPSLNTAGNADRARAGDAVNPLGFAVAAALGNIVGALAVVRHERRSLQVIDAGLAFGAGFMLAVAVLGMMPEVLRDNPSARALRALRLSGRSPGAARLHSPLPFRGGDPPGQRRRGHLGAARASRCTPSSTASRSPAGSSSPAGSASCSSWRCCCTSCRRA